MENFIQSCNASVVGMTKAKRCFFKEVIFLLKSLLKKKQRSSFIKESNIMI